MKILTYERMTQIEKILWYSFCFVGVTLIVLIIGAMVLSNLYDLWMNDPETAIMFICVIPLAIIICVIISLWVDKREQLRREQKRQNS